jgi:hypothetical protein
MLVVVRRKAVSSQPTREVWNVIALPLARATTAALPLPTERRKTPTCTLFCESASAWQPGDRKQHLAFYRALAVFLDVPLSVVFRFQNEEAAVEFDHKHPAEG